MMVSLRRFSLLAATSALGLALSACSASNTPAPTGGAAPSSPAASATSAPATSTPAAPAASAEKIGGTVSVLATWGGDEQAAFMEMVKPFEEQTGVKVEYEGTRDLNAVLTTRVQGGNPPDVAGLPGPGQMAEFAKAGKLVDLSGVLDATAMKAQYADDWLTLGQADGKQVGIFVKASLKGLVWYNPKEFQKAGYTVPKTWDELMTLSQKIADTGTTPWCIGLESGAASGWPATDWLEDIVLRQAGPEVYDQWHQGQIKWSSPAIKQAWETWGTIVADPKMVYGGAPTMLTTNFGESGNPLFSSPPGCFLHHQASFITTFFTDGNPNLKVGEDFTFFAFPDIDPKYAGAVEGGGDLFGMFKDTPQSRALIKYLASPEAQAIWVKRGGALSANKLVQAASYPDAIARGSAQILTSARIVRFDASDLMPEAMNAAFFKAALDYVSNPQDLDRILAGLDQVQAEAYKK